ncbi:MAG TPA: nuclear transport factor 2 family protein [Acidimicrobiales bacterium]|nr:nuclear transport factor 2 family protein [Acidimicrobiales bacterium]
MDGLSVEDRLALRALADAYADAVDRRQAGEVAALYAPDGSMEVADEHDPAADGICRRGRDEIARSLRVLSHYQALTHVVGGQVLHAGEEDATATGTTTCLAHHVLDRHGRRVLQTMGVKYHDRYVRLDEGWRFTLRRIEFQWRDERELPAPAEEDR